MNKGDRVELIHCNDPYTRLKPGERGTVTLIDDLGTVHVRWEGGSSLGLCREDGDAWRVLERKLRYADVRGARSSDEVAAYLPDDYHVFRSETVEDRLVVTIRGVDRLGWTLDDYVLPRLASGLMFGEERPVPADAAVYAE